MQEIWSTLIARVISWPVAILILTLVFRRHIGGLLERATHFAVKHGETSVEATVIASALVQTEKSEKKPDPASLDAPAVGATKDAVITATNISQAEVNTDARQAMIDFGKGIEAVRVREAVIRDHLSRMNFPLNEGTTTDILVRNLAFNQAVAAAERLYRLVFGSQIALLRFLNTTYSRKDSEMHPFYEAAKETFPKFYVGYPYESWKGFLLDQNVIAEDPQIGNAYGITRVGRDFLSWMIAEGLSESKAG